MQNEALEELAQLVEKCRKNRQAVPEADLNGRYAKSYRSLKKEIAEKAEALIPEMLVSDFPVLSGKEMESLCEGIQDVINRKSQEGYSTKMGDALVSFCDLGVFLDYISLIQCDIAEYVYMDYWLSHTVKRGGTYYNEIIDMEYVPDLDIWIKDRAFGIYFPPEKDSYLECVASQRLELSTWIQEGTVPERVVQCA